MTVRAADYGITTPGQDLINQIGPFGSGSGRAPNWLGDIFRHHESGRTGRLTGDPRYDAMIHESDNNLRAEKDSNLTWRFAIMKNSQDVQFQIMAWLTSQLEGLDTKTQIAMKDAEVRLSQIGADYDIQKRQIKLEEREFDLREQETRRAREVETGSFLT